MAKGKAEAQQETAPERKQQSKRRQPQPALSAAEVKSLAKAYKALLKQIQGQLDRAVALMEECESRGTPVTIQPATSNIKPTLIRAVKQTHWFESMATTAALNSGVDPSSVG